MMDMMKMMKQAKELQGKMQAMQDELAEISIVGSAGAGMVRLTLNGKGELQGIKVDPSLLNPEETEILEDLIVTAHRDARQKTEETMASKTQEVMGGLGLPPGFKMPF
jgi:DNA-binding YbaB/EbfC family protein